MISASRRMACVLAGACLASAANAQQPTAAVVAVPPLSTPADKPTSAGGTLSLAWQASQLIADDLRSTSEIVPLPPEQKDYYSYPEVTAPTFSRWRAVGAKMLVTGFLQARSDGRVTFGCYVYDVDKGREVARKGYVIAPEEWGRAAHKCSGLAYTAVTGAPGIFDSRIAYVAESVAGASKVSRVAIMDSDGTNQRYLTGGEARVLTPRLSPKAARVAYVTFAGGTPQVHVMDATSGTERPLIPGAAMTFAPRFSPDGTRIVFSMMLGANSDIYVTGADGGLPQRLTTAPGVDTDPSFSPDGSKIVFESDRSGSQQLYVMNSDGSNQRRLTFGGAWYASPEWSPDGNWIAFTRRASDGRRIGIIRPDSTGEKVLTSGPADEGPSWAPSSRELMFQREVAGVSSIYRVSLDGSPPRRVKIQQGGSDPDWSGVMD